MGSASSVPVIPADAVTIGAQFARGSSGFVCHASLRGERVIAKVRCIVPSEHTFGVDPPPFDLS
jgi:hypothetical protein